MLHINYDPRVIEIVVSLLTVCTFKFYNSITVFFSLSNHLYSLPR